MTEQTSNNSSASSHHPNFIEKIVDKITGKHHDHSSSSEEHKHQHQHQHQQHQYGAPANEHDNAYIAESSIVGAHAIPPMTTHADPNHLHDTSYDQAKTKAQTQAIANPPANPQQTKEPFQELGDRLVGHDYHSTETEHQRPLM